MTIMVCAGDDITLFSFISRQKYYNNGKDQTNYKIKKWDGIEISNCSATKCSRRFRYDMVWLDYRIPRLPSRVESVSDELGLTEMISASENKNVVVVYLRCKGCSRF